MPGRGRPHDDAARRTWASLAAAATATTIALVTMAGVIAGVGAGGAGASPSNRSAAADSKDHASGFHAPKSGYIVYWDQNEEEDYYASSSNSEGQLVRPWDPNGQMCIVPHTGGQFVVGYDPTNPSQHNPGGPPHHPFKQPPDGLELDRANGTFTGKTLYLPGPFRMDKGAPSSDVPPDAQGIYNGQSTFTGCATDSRGDVFGADIATAQGQFPVPSSGRLIEWFAPSYTTACILYGPTTGGVGPHHVDGSGGLAQPGMMAAEPDGDLLLPVAGAPPGQLIGGQVWEFDASSFPTSAAQCPGNVYPRSKIRYRVWLKGTPSFMPFPMGVAHDPTCGCYAVSTAFGTPAIAWFSPQGTLLTSHATIPGETISELGKLPNGYNPFGMAFAPDGTLYFVDIHLQCTGVLQNCGPENMNGRVLRITFADGQPSAPTVVAGDFDFPTSVTICVPGHGVCPFPTSQTPPPDRATLAEGAP